MTDSSMLDSQIKLLSERINTIIDNYEALKQVPLFLSIVEGTFNLHAIEPTSLQKVLQIRAACNQFDIDIGFLLEVQQRYAEKRATLNILNSKPVLAELQSILRDAWIVRSHATIPIERRELLSPQEQVEKVSAEELLRIMGDSYRNIRDTICHAQKLSDEVISSVQPISGQLRSLRLELKQLGTSSTEELDELERNLDQLSRACHCDIFNLENRANAINLIELLKRAERSVGAVKQRYQALLRAFREFPVATQALNFQKVDLIRLQQRARQELELDLVQPDTRDVSALIDEMEKALSKPDLDLATAILHKFEQACQERTKVFRQERITLENKLKVASDIKTRWNNLKAETEQKAASSDKALQAFKEQIEALLEKHDFANLCIWFDRYEMRLKLL
ncbi:MAG: hypothetical protein SFV17_03260 [Candidatus Obscuribacter sp.]|nr:hypothetical protein [Candidatus Melainabacteria bacterium]MDX1985684.1 hypothetical protein [Candidatus Obscuribacter sp.]